MKLIKANSAEMAGSWMQKFDEFERMLIIACRLANVLALEAVSPLVLLAKIAAEFDDLGLTAFAAIRIEIFNFVQIHENMIFVAL